MIDLFASFSNILEQVTIGIGNKYNRVDGR